MPILPVPEDLRDRVTRRSAISSKSAALTQVADCGELAKVLRAQGIADAIELVQASFATAWDQKDGCDAPSSDAMAMADGGAAVAAPTPGAEPDAPEHSETNNQTAGVDEPDIVKTDGKRIYVLADDKLQIVKAWPAEQAALIGEAAIEGTPKKLLLHGDRVLVYSALPRSDGHRECTYGYDCALTGDGLPTKISVFDVSDPATPKLVREIVTDASLIAARRIGAAVHTVVTKSASQGHRRDTVWPKDLGNLCQASRYEIYAAYKDLLRQELLRALAATPPPASAVMPKLTDSAGTRALDGCKLHRAALEDGHQVTSVLSLSIADASPVRAVSILSPPGVVYGAEQALYLAVSRSRGTAGWFEGFAQSRSATAIHKLALTSGGAPGARYAASGLAAGTLLNQFALDEHEGFLRVAGTDFGRPRHNTLTVLEQQGKLLKRVGLLEGLAPTEDIRSVRFDGPRGYVVTFKQTDPLFVIDLADPKQPKVDGELKIPGFSTYIHKLDDDHLLTIGYDGDDAGSFAWFSAVALQIFDVSDPTQPKLKHKHAIGTRGSSSEALTNHLAFTYFAPKNLLALPMTICEGGGWGSYGDSLTFSGLLLFDTTAQKGFVERGRVTHPLGPEVRCDNWWTHGNSQVKRSLIIGDYVYSLSGERLKVNHLDAPQTDVADVALGAATGAVIAAGWEEDEAPLLIPVGAESSTQQAQSGSRSLRCETQAKDALSENFSGHVSEARLYGSHGLRGFGPNGQLVPGESYWLEAWYYLPSQRWTPAAGSTGDYILRIASGDDGAAKRPQAGLAVRPSPTGENRLIATLGRDGDVTYDLGPLSTDRWFSVRLMLRPPKGQAYAEQDQGLLHVWVDGEPALLNHHQVPKLDPSTHLAFGLYSPVLGAPPLSGPGVGRELFLDSLRVWTGADEPTW